MNQPAFPFASYSTQAGNLVSFILIFILYVQNLIYLSWRYHSESARIPVSFILHTIWRPSDQSPCIRKLPYTVLNGDEPTASISAFISTPAPTCTLWGTWKGAFFSPSKLWPSELMIGNPHNLCAWQLNVLFTNV